MQFAHRCCLGHDRAVTETRTWFVTGASRGLGREMVEQLLARGDRVAATLRRPEQLDHLADAHPGRLWVAPLDVTDAGQVRQVLGRAFADLGRVDVVVSNAGKGVFGTAEDVSDEQVDAMITTNLTGSIQLARAALPHLRAQGGGRMVQISSMGAHLAFPAFGLYHTTKWGIEGFYEALAQEVAPFGITTMLVEPGRVRTGFYEAAEQVPISEPYRGGPADVPAVPPEDMAGDQAKTVAAIIGAATADDPPRRLVLGSDAQRWIRAALAQRLAAVDAQHESAARTDVDGWDRDRNGSVA